MAEQTVVINVVALSESLIGTHCPNIKSFADRGRLSKLLPDLPAVTCTSQASMLTGLPPREHGIVGNGWYFRDLAEVHFWKQSNHLVKGEKVWETARRIEPSVTCCNIGWWYNMYSSVEFSITPRPIYRANGKKIPFSYTEPADLLDEIHQHFGRFPLKEFWGPLASIRSSKWIGDVSMFVHDKYNPTLSLIYLPHLDYPLQKLGPEHPSIPSHLRQVDCIVGDLLRYFEDKGCRVIIVSEYGIEQVDDAVPINRYLRKNGLLRVRDELGKDHLDAGASAAFAVTDHQIAHVYIKDPRNVARCSDLCASIPGVAQVLSRADQARMEIDHPRAGELILVSDARRWFTYDFWLHDDRAPDFAKTVDLFRKPGYDPRELFFDPTIRFPRIRMAERFIRSHLLGQRVLYDLIPLETTLVRGSHGRHCPDPKLQPVMITQIDGSWPEQMSCRFVRDVILKHMGLSQSDLRE